MAPYSLSTTIFAFGPTVNRNSFLVSAATPVTRQAATTRPAIVLHCILAIPLVSSRIKPACPLLNTIQGHLVQHLFLFVRFHQMLPRIFIVRILLQIGLRVPDIRIYGLELLLIGRPHFRSDSVQKLLVRCAGGHHGGVIVGASAVVRFGGLLVCDGL